MTDWKENSSWEKSWWGNCLSTCYYETTKQAYVYAPKMGLKVEYSSQGPHIQTRGAILDVGGGPCSMLLLANEFSNAIIVDPCVYPNWVMQRYAESKITFIKDMGENILEIPEISFKIFDETWVYNCLQHVEDPELIVQNVLSTSKLIRIFEWVENGVSPGHPQNLTEKDLNKWLGGNGKVEHLDGENGCKGLCYYGIFKGNHYGE